MHFKAFLLMVLSVGLTGLVLFFLFNSSIPARLSDLPQATPTDARAYLLPLSEANLLPILNSQIPVPEISAKALIAFDVKTGKILWEKNANLKLPIASLTKILSAMVVADNVNQEDVVIIPKEDVKVDTEKQDLHTGEKITVENLLKLMLIQSSNDSAYALADYVQKTQNVDFVQKMNEKTLSLGMFDSYFLDPAGLDDNGFSTVNDLVKLVTYSLKYDKIWSLTAEQEAVVPSVDGRFNHVVRSTNQLLGVVPGIVGGKTGQTPLALGCLIMIFEVPDFNDKIITVVLGSNDRFGDTRKIIEWVRKAYRWN